MILPDKPAANDMVFTIRNVWVMIYVLSTTLMSRETRAAVERRYRSSKCAHCYKPLLEHVYDSSNGTVLHWQGNCAIVKSKKTG
jgi:hypothetical protein